MLITSHIVSTILIGEAFSFAPAETVVAFVAGVAIDVDHLFVSKKWVSDVKNFLLHGITTHGEVKQHSWLQEPLFGIVVGVAVGVTLSILFFGIRWWIFPLFQAIHILMDSLMQYEHEPLVPISRWKYGGFIPSATKTEFLGSSLALVAIYIML